VGRKPTHDLEIREKWWNEQPEMLAKKAIETSRPKNAPEPEKQDPPETTTSEERIASLRQNAIPALLGVDHRQTLGGTLLAQIISVQKVWGSEDETQALRLALDTAIAFKPRNPIEALLITQMAGVHAAAVSALYKAGLQGQPYEIAELYTNRASRLMRLYMQQTEALSKLRGESGQQRIVVERVNVNAGGQAIVGVIANDRRPEVKVGE
jgi:hypothetical protein